MIETSQEDTKVDLLLDFKNARMAERIKHHVFRQSKQLDFRLIVLMPQKSLHDLRMHETP